MTCKFCKETLISDITDYLSVRIADHPKHKYLDTSFSLLGLDSADHVQLSTIVEDHLQMPVDPTVAFDYPTINSLVNYLEQQFLASVQPQKVH